MYWGLKHTQALWNTLWVRVQSWKTHLKVTPGSLYETSEAQDIKVEKTG